MVPPKFHKIIEFSFEELIIVYLFIKMKNILDVFFVVVFAILNIAYVLIKLFNFSTCRQEGFFLFDFIFVLKQPFTLK